MTSHVFVRNSQMQNPHVAARGVVPGWRLSKKVINAYGGLPFVTTDATPAEEYRRVLSRDRSRKTRSIAVEIYRYAQVSFVVQMTLK